MRMNSDESIATARRVLDAFGGSWSAVRRNAVRNAQGALVVRLRDGGDNRNAPPPGAAERG